MTTSVLPAMPNTDLGREIEKHRNAATELANADTEFHALQTRLNRHGLMLTIMPFDGNGNAGQQIVAIDAKARRQAHGKGDQRLGDILFAQLQKNPTKHLSVQECVQAATDAGYQSKSDNFYGVVLSMLNHDLRFKKFKQKGKRNILVGLSHKV